MTTALTILFILVTLSGFGMLMKAEYITHQTVAILVLLIAAVCFVGACVCSKLDGIRKEIKQLTKSKEQ